jgi:large subunit ribosomal protein L35
MRVQPATWRRQPKKDDAMPKMKTDRGAAKRIKVTGTGRLRRRKAFRSHLLENKSSVRTRRLGRETEIAKADQKATRRMLGL